MRRLRSGSVAVKNVAAILVAVGFASVGMGEASQDSLPALHLSLAEVERQALEHSPAVKAVGADSAAAKHRADSQYGLLFPKLSFEASGRYVSEVPALALIPGRPAVPFGDNENYSVGPVLTYTLWDSGGTYNAWKSAVQSGEAKGREFEASKRQTVLAARNLYFKVQLFLEQQRLVGDSLRLVSAQNRDIEAKLRAGAASRIDALSSHREVLNLELQFRQSQADLASALRELFALTGLGAGVDVSLPVDERLEDLAAAKETPRATVKVGVDGFSQSIAALESTVQKSEVPHPQAEALEYAAKASQKAASAARAGHYPKVFLTAKSSIDYPNGPILEKVHQNMVGVTATLSLFEWGRVSNEIGARQAEAEAAEYRHAQVVSDLDRDRNKAGDQLAALKSNRPINEQAVRETEELARLVYSSYRAGRTNLLEVQSANLKALEAKVQAARNEVQILIQLAVLNYLGSR